MKNYAQALTPVTFTAILALFLSLSACTPKTDKETRTAGTNDSLQVASLPIAYVNLDSLLTGYRYSRDLQDEFMRKAESRQATINQQGKALEADMAEFQRKVENNAFFDQDRARREQERILKRQQDFQALSQKLNMEMQEEQLKMNTALSDTIRSLIKLYNDTKGHYQVIFSNTMGDNLLYAAQSYDITEEVIDFLNDRYKPASDSPAAEPAK